MGRKLSYQSGNIYGYLMLTGKSYFENERRVECICKCGSILWPFLNNLRRKNTSSCECLQKEKVSTHELSHHPLYSVYKTMKSRCYTSSHSQYNDYGGRGISICAEWLNNFMSFYKWSIENGYKKGLTIDRQNNDGNYEPTNCRWTTQIVQTRNTRRNRFLQAFGEIKCIQDWVNDNRCTINLGSVQKRLKKGWGVEDAISIPSTTYNKNYKYK